MNKFRLFVSAITVMFALSGMSACGNSTADDVQSGDTSVSAVDDSVSTAQPPEDIIAVTLSGESFSLRDELSQKPVVLWFWAPG